MSHSGELVLIAISRQPVGIDLEAMDSSLDWALLATAHCHPREQAYIVGDTPAGAMDDSLNLEAFTQQAPIRLESNDYLTRQEQLEPNARSLTRDSFRWPWNKSALGETDPEASKTSVAPTSSYAVLR